MNEAQTLVRTLIRLGLSFSEIAKRTDDRVSERTIRRYYHGEVHPRQSSVVKVLQRIINEVTKESST